MPARSGAAGSVPLKLPRPLRRFEKVIRVLIPVGILGVILIAVTTVGFVHYSSQPGFCNNCHIMQPYYDSWTTSSHREISCIQCHIPPGIRSEAETKIDAANMVVSYFTGTYGTKPWAEVEDASCLRSGCHSERLIEGTVDYNGVKFDHRPHLGELRRGIQLRCTSCHSQIVQGDHIAVTGTTCFLCHFGERQEAKPLAGCTGCHQDPPRIVTKAGQVVDHRTYAKNNASCLSCHSQVIHGEGAVEQSRCFSCHNEPERLDVLSDQTMLHKVHVADHDVSCTLCHSPIEHKVVELKATMELDCKGCHTGVHRQQQRLFAGVGGHGAKETPSSMFLARVSCQGCHEKSATIRGHDGVKLAGEASCLSCHGIKYVNILPAWQKDMAAKTAKVRAVVDRAAGAVRAMPAGRRATADSLVRLARENLALVEVGKGAHNMEYADRLLRASVTLVRDAVRRGGLPMPPPSVDLGPPVSQGSCLSCHTGIESRTVQFAGRPFPHDAHVARGNLQCETCHTPLDAHGGTKLTAASCATCHHPDTPPPATTCASCHRGGGPAGAPADSVRIRGDKRLPHSLHAADASECTACHTPPGMSAKKLACADCHEDRHTKDGSCLSCHAGGVMAKHEFPKWDHDGGCADCHTLPALKEWSRPVCLACHADRVEHYPPDACTDCHEQPPLVKPAASPPAPVKPGGVR